MKKRYAQNSIDYMVFHQPQKARQLLENHGYESINDEQQLAKAIKQLIQRKGKPVIESLLQHHPDKNAIISVVKPKCSQCQNKIDTNTCTSCAKRNQNSNGDSVYEIPVSQMSLEALQRDYQMVLLKAQKEPTNQRHSLRLQTIQTEINGRKKEKKKRTLGTEEIAVLIGVFVLGFVCGKLSNLKA